MSSLDRAATVLLCFGDGVERYCAAVVASPRLLPFLDRDSCDHEGGYGVVPGPAEQGVAEQPGQQDGGEVGAQRGLRGAGDG